MLKFDISVFLASFCDYVYEKQLAKQFRKGV